MKNNHVELKGTLTRNIEVSTLLIAKLFEYES